MNCVLLAEMVGVEPTIQESKSCVLPLHYIPMLEGIMPSAKENV